MPTDRVLIKRIDVKASLDEVWQAWSTSEGAQTFFAPDALIELRLDGPYELYFMQDAPAGQQGSEGCRILSFVPGEMLSFTWNAPPHLPDVRKQRSFVVLRFEKLPDGLVRVNMHHRGWGEGEQWDQAYAYFDRAWDIVLSRLKQRFQEGPIDWEKL